MFDTVQTELGRILAEAIMLMDREEVSGKGSITVCKDSWHSVGALTSNYSYIDTGARDVNGISAMCETVSDSQSETVPEQPPLLLRESEER